MQQDQFSHLQVCHIQVRHLIDQVVRTGRKLKSEHTGFVMHEKGSISKESISLYDNFLFVLALFRTKSQEHVQEGAKLLEKLLYFQQTFSELEAFGAYPVFVHDFPLKCDLLTSVRILRVLFWLQKEFCHVLAKELAQKIEKAIERLAAYCQAEYEQEYKPLSLPVYISCSIEALLFAFDKIQRSKTLLSQEAFVMLDPECLAELIASYHVAPTLCDFSPLWQYLAKSWHTPSCGYAGPAFSLSQEGFEPKVSLYDYYMGFFTSHFAKRADKEIPQALHAALVRKEHALQRVELPTQDHGAYKGFSWSRYCEETFALSLIKGTPFAHQRPNFFPFYLLTTNHTLAMQAPVGSVGAYSFDAKGNTKRVTIVIDFEKELFLQEKELPKVLSFWFDNTPNTQLTIRGGKASCFELGEPICITLSALQITLKARRLSGDSQFVWHVIRSNRPSQIGGQEQGAKENFVKENLQAYDVELFLRPLRATEDCRIELLVELLHF